MDTRFTIELRSKRREELTCKVHRDLHSSLRMYIADGIDLTWRPLPKCMSMSTTTTIKTSVTTQLGFKWWLENHLWRVIWKIEDSVACLPEDLSVQLTTVCSFRSHQQKPMAAKVCMGYHSFKFIYIFKARWKIYPRPIKIYRIFYVFR